MTDKVAYTYDELGRTAKRTVTVDGRAYETSYAYIAGEQAYTPEETDDDTPTYATTGLIASISQTGGNFEYDYDDNGNITRVIQDGVTTEYTYDALGQLIQVDDEQENATWVYEYDQGGNILSKKKYALGETSGTAIESKVFAYNNSNWKDQLSKVNNVSITYDDIGNPIDDGIWSYTWEKGRQLQQMATPGEIVDFKYNENGLRIQKVATSTGTTNYTLHGKNIVHMTRDKGEEHDTLHFFYDASNKPAIVEYNGVKYAYVHNLQGDIVAILDSNGNNVVEYKYDAWGKPISKTGSMKDSLGTLNPFRYRGYVYDEETGLYYLRSRYFNPVMCKFINADMVLGMRGVLAHNLYCYCKNRPCQFYDPDGLEEEWYFPPELIWTYTPSPTASPTPCPTPRPNYVNGHYYMITPLSHSTGVYLEGENGDYSKLGATAYRYNQSSGLPEYYVGEYQDGYFFLYCESIYGRADAGNFEYVLETDVVAHRYGGLSLTKSGQTYCAYATIRNLQEDLIYLGYNIGGDQIGFYGEGTFDAVESFQIAEGLRPDGQAGEKTLPTLFHKVHYVGPVW